MLDATAQPDSTTGLCAGTGPGLYKAAIGHSRLLAAPHDRRLHLLDPLGAALLDFHRQGCSAPELAALLTDALGLPPDAARARVQAHWRQWRAAGLLSATASPGSADQADAARWRLDQPDDPVWPAPQPRPLPQDARRVVVADRHIALQCADPLLRQRVHNALGPALAAQAQAWAMAEADHALALLGAADAWYLQLDETRVAEGTSADAALLATLSTLTELGCRPAERLLVVHGAGLLAADGRGMLLVAPGGSGKTTLAAALDAAGFGLLSDDVVPVSRAGALLGLGLPLCLKPGSWPVLSVSRPALTDHPPVQRFGQAVRCVPALHPAAGAAVPAACVLLSRYAPGTAASHERVSPEAALQGLVEAEAVLRDITQPKLEALAQWLNQVPAYRLQYPDLATGLRLVQTLADAPAAGPAPHPSWA